MYNPEDKRTFIFQLVSSHVPKDEKERQDKERMLDLIASHETCFENDNEVGHITGSALVVDQNFQYTLLTHHAKLDRWFQFGGHSDGDPNTLSVGLREAMEESGMKSISFIGDHTGIADIDIHPIPKDRSLETPHEHFDIRQILMADMSEKYVVTNESKDLQWIKLSDVSKYNTQPAFLRLAEKAMALREIG